MKISIDYDGTLWSHMNFFRELMVTMQHQGHRIGILTAHRERRKEEDLLEMRKNLIPSPDFWYGRPNESTDSYAEFKSLMIVGMGIDMHFDDMNGNNLETEEEFNRLLGYQRYRVIHVCPRFPLSSRYE